MLQVKGVPSWHMLQTEAPLSAWANTHPPTAPTAKRGLPTQRPLLLLLKVHLLLVLVLQVPPAAETRAGPAAGTPLVVRRTVCSCSATAASTPTEIGLRAARGRGGWPVSRRRSGCGVVVAAVQRGIRRLPAVPGCHGGPIVVPPRGGEPLVVRDLGVAGARPAGVGAAAVDAVEIRRDRPAAPPARVRPRQGGGGLGPCAQLRDAGP